MKKQFLFSLLMCLISYLVGFLTAIKFLAEKDLQKDSEPKESVDMGKWNEKMK
jgi:hypothetical protein